MRVGHIVVCRLYNFAANLPDAWSTQLLGELPEGFKPPAGNQIRQPLNVANATGGLNTAALWINADGNLYVACFGGAGIGSHAVSCTATWVVE